MQRNLDRLNSEARIAPGPLIPQLRSYLLLNKIKRPSSSPFPSQPVQEFRQLLPPADGAHG